MAIMNLKVTDIEETDKNAIVSWFELFLNDHLRNWKNIYGTEPKLRSGLAEKQWNMLLDASHDPSHLVRIARDDGQPVGVVWGVVKDDDWFNCKTGYIFWIAINPNFKGRGIGKLLMEMVEDWFKIQEVRGRSLNVSSANGSAIKLYQKFGYQIADHKMIGPGVRLSLD